MFLIVYVEGGNICSYLEEHAMNFEEKLNIWFNLCIYKVTNRTSNLFKHLFLLNFRWHQRLFI